MLNLNEKKKAVLYVRVSSTEQEREGYSIPAQKKLLVDYAEKHNFEIVQTFEEAETAKCSGREQFTLMMRYLKNEAKKKSENKCRTLLVEKTDRLYRNFKDYVELDPEEINIDIHFVKEGKTIGPNAKSGDKFMHALNVALSKRFNDNLSEETKKGITEKAEQGIWPTHAPLGYLNKTEDNGRKVITLDPERKDYVRKVFEKYSTGKYSVLEISNYAYKIGLRSKKNKKVHKSTMQRMLRHRVYTGNFDWMGKTYQGIHEPIVDEELWQKVQDILTERYDNKRRKSKHNHTYARMIKCGHCGCSIVGQLKKKKYIYYYCSGFKGKCPEPYVREEVLTEQFAEYLDSLVFEKPVIDWVVNALRENHAEHAKEQEKAIKRLRADYDKLQERIDACYVDKLDGKISIDNFERLSANWRAKQEELNVSIASYEKSGQNRIEDGITLLKLANNAKKMFLKQPSEEKRKLLNFVLWNCSWKDGKLTADYQQPFDIIAKNKPKLTLVNGELPSEKAKIEEWGG